MHLVVVGKVTPTYYDIMINLKYLKNYTIYKSDQETKLATKVVV